MELSYIVRNENAIFSNFEVFWNATARQIINRNQRSVGYFCLHLQVEAIKEKRNASFWVLTQRVLVIPLTLEYGTDSLYRNFDNESLMNYYYSLHQHPRKTQSSSTSRRKPKITYNPWKVWLFLRERSNYVSTKIFKNIYQSIRHKARKIMQLYLVVIIYSLLSTFSHVMDEIKTFFCIVKSR